MVFLNYSTMQMVAKIVYYGPGLCGKTTNLKEIYRKTSVKSRGEMVSLETETDRTLFFDLLPMDVGIIGGFKTKFQLYTVPGQVFYNSTRKLVLRGVDGIVFVADSQIPMLDANLDSFDNLKENLEELGLDLGEIPFVFQFNKRDLTNIHPVEKLNAILNDYNRPFIESSALKGIGVFETLKEISKQTLLKLRAKAVGNELRKKETVALKIRGSKDMEKIKNELEKESLSGPLEEEHTLVKEDALPTPNLELPREDAIPENVSFDTYEMEDGETHPDPSYEPSQPHLQVQDLDATDPESGTKAATKATTPNLADDGPTLDHFDLDLPEVDLLSVEDELDLSALHDLHEQVNDDLSTEPILEPLSANAIPLPKQAEETENALPDEPQESPEVAPILDLKEPAKASTPPVVPKAGPTSKAPQFDISEELKLEEVTTPAKKTAKETLIRAEDTVPNEVVSVRTSAGRKQALSSTLRELENLNLNMPRPKTTKFSTTPLSVDDLLTSLIASPKKKKVKAQKVAIKLPKIFNQAQINCIFLDDRQNVVHTQLAKLSPVEIENGKYQIKVTLDIEIES